MCEPVRHRVLITGASGLLGSALVTALEATHTVYAFSHSRSLEGKYPISVTCKQLDLTDEAAIRSAIAEIKPHAILHTAAVCRSETIDADRARAEAINVKASQVIASAASELSSTWVIFFSTADVFSTSDGVCKPNSPAHPTSVFGEMKLRAEEAVRTNFPSAGVLRLSKVYGVTSRASDCRVTHVIHRLAHTKPGHAHTFDNETVYSPVWAPDVAYMCQQLLERKQKHCGFSGTWHWSGQERLTDYAIAVQAAPLLGVPLDSVKPSAEPPQLKPLHPDLDVGMLKVMGVSRQTPLSETIPVIVNEVKRTRPQ